MHLSKYMADNGLSDEKVAAAIGKSRVSVTRYRNGKMRPNWETTERICEWSNGAVTPNDWLPQTEAA